MRIVNNKIAALGLSVMLFSNSPLPVEAWTAAEAVSDSPSSFNPTPSCLAIDQNSNAIVGWLNGEVGTANELFTASLPAGAPHWSDPVALYTGTPPAFATFPVLYADNDGIIHAQWVDFSQSGAVYDQTTLYSTTQATLGTSWPAPLGSATLTGFAANGGGQVDESGNCIGLIALSADSNTYAPPFEITMVALPNGASEWTAPLNLGTDTGTTSPVIFGSAFDGAAVIGWKISSGLSFKTARYDFASNVVTAINDIPLPAGASDIGFVRSVLAANGDAIVLFGVQIGLSTNFAIYSTFLPEGSDTWTYPELVSDPANNTTGQFLSIKADDNANATVLWGELTPLNEGFIRAGSLSFGGSISDVQDLTDPDTLVGLPADLNSGVLLDVDDFGNAVAIWQFQIDGAPTVQVASKAAGEIWGVVETLSSTGKAPRVALSNQGTAVAAWLDSDTNLVYSSRSNNLFALAPPSGFGGYISHSGSSYYLHTYWDQSYAPNIVNYKIYKNDVLVASISGDGPYTHSIHLGCGYLDGEYTLVAVASNGNQSTPIDLTLVE